MSIEFSNTIGRGRRISTANGPQEIRDLRKLGMPDWLATKVEKRAATQPAARKKPVDLVWQAERFLLFSLLRQSYIVHQDLEK